MTDYTIIKQTDIVTVVNVADPVSTQTVSIGTQGPVGIQGNTGIAGTNGTNGNTGSTGSTGVPGGGYTLLASYNWDLSNPTFSSSPTTPAYYKPVYYRYKCSVDVNPPNGVTLNIVSDGIYAAFAGAPVVPAYLPQPQPYVANTWKYGFISANQYNTPFTTAFSAVSTLRSGVTSGIVTYELYGMDLTQPGNPGATGPTGADGFMGSDGKTGATGPVGATGADGSSVNFGATGLTGATGLDGAQGNTGQTGAAGTDGINGQTGNTGAAGSTGATGNDGAVGQTGATGTDGINGQTGNTGATGAGETGAVGATGQDGAVGQTGATGLDGAVGATGNDGAIGATGNDGAIGATGNDGLNGQTGATGQDGAAGATGNDGLNGQTGATGQDGAAGATGNDGAAGSTGATGNNGSTGSQGNTGSAGATGQTGAGTQGQTGMTGQTGVGIQGQTGMTGQTGVGTQGLTGKTGATGMTGMTGFGNTGMTGMTGVGTQGNTGMTGMTGAGIQGQTGMTGQTGVGIQGQTGMTGQTGVGTQGNTGSQGNTGNTGNTGAGIAGTTGATGATGSSTPAGSTGMLQYNLNNSTLGATASLHYDSAVNHLEILGTNPALCIGPSTTQPTPEASELIIYNKPLAGRYLPSWMPPSGVNLAAQPSFFGSNIAMYWATGGTNGGASTGISGMGTVWAASGTVTHPTPAAGMVSQMRRTRYTSSTTVLLSQGIISTASGYPSYWMGNAAGLGGFFFHARFTIELIPSGAIRLFVGLTSLTASMTAGTTTEPSAQAGSYCGLSHDSTEAISVLNFITKNGTTATKAAITLTGNTLAAGQGYDFYMFVKPNTQEVFYRLDDIGAGTTLVDTSTTTTVPAATTFMGPQVVMGNANVAATTVAIGINKVYVEADH